LALDATGNLFFSDGGTRIRKISTNGTINTVVGNGTMGFPSGLGDGGPATSASLSGFVGGLAVDAAGNLLIADTANERIRKVSADGIIRTVAGGGTNYRGDGVIATDAGIDPWGIVIDGANNLFVASRGGALVRKISSSGIITTVAGKADFSELSGDGG